MGVYYIFVYTYTTELNLFCIKSSIFKRKGKEVETLTESNHESAQEAKVSQFLNKTRAVYLK